MADAIYAGVCDLIGLGRGAVLEPGLPREILLNSEYDDDGSVAMSHIVRGQWFSNMIPVKVVGAGLPIQFFYYNMRRLGAGLNSQPDISIPGVVFISLWETVRGGLMDTMQKIIALWGGGPAKVE